MAEITITTENFEEEVVKSEIPVLIDFWATWCGPCKMIAPTVEEIAEEYEGKIKVGKVNVDEEGQLTEAFGISSIPTLVLMKDGKTADMMVGLRSKSEIVKMFEE